MKKIFTVFLLLCFSAQSFAGWVTLSISNIPSPFYEWDTNPPSTPVIICVTVNPAGSSVIGGIIKLSLKYFAGTGNEIIVRQYTMTSVTVSVATSRNFSFNIQAAYACSNNVQLIAELSSAAGFATNSNNITISGANAIYTDGPYGTYLGGNSRSACRWTEEPITIRMCAGLPADESDIPNHIISNYGSDITNGFLSNTYTYALSSSDGIGFADPNGNPITAMQFTNGRADLKISMTETNSAAVFHLSNRSYSGDILTSSTINIQNPLFEWQNIADQTAYSLYTAAKVRATNNISPVPFHNFPMANFLLTASPSNALSVSHTGFSGSGSAYTDSLVLNCGAVNSNVSIGLAYFGDAAPISTSPLFNINPPVSAPAASRLVNRQVLIDNLNSYPELTFVGRVLGPRADYPFIVSNNTVIDKGEMTNRFYLYAVSNTTLTAKGGLGGLTYDLADINIIDPGPYYITNASALTNDRIVYHVQGYSNQTVILKVKTRTLTFTGGIAPVEKEY
jgi:hypothetical protein